MILTINKLEGPAGRGSGSASAAERPRPCGGSSSRCVLGYFSVAAFVFCFLIFFAGLQQQQGRRTMWRCPSLVSTAPCPSLHSQTSASTSASGKNQPFLRSPSVCPETNTLRRRFQRFSLRHSLLRLVPLFSHYTVLRKPRCPIFRSDAPWLQPPGGQARHDPEQLVLVVLDRADPCRHQAGRAGAVAVHEANSGRLPVDAHSPAHVHHNLYGGRPAGCYSDCVHLGGRCICHPGAVPDHHCVVHACGVLEALGNMHVVARGRRHACNR